MAPDERHQQVHGRRQKAAAWAVHAFTASGIVLGCLALMATLEGDRLAAFLWLGLALFVDGIDGTLARKVRVREVIPQFDGATLDNVIDYFNYVAVPAVMVYAFGLVPAGWETWTAAFIMAVSCYTFANVNMKTTDYYFQGFPALWNLVVLYAFVLQTGQWTNLIIIAICGVLTFVPWKYVHPLRVKNWRVVTLTVTVLWAATSLRLVFDQADTGNAQEASPLVFWLWVGASVYFAALSVWRSRLFAGRAR
ncbi:MAG: phosphatidylcholine/phosphatidylserine synthase [Geminicoccaceae bacterium]|nr:MAG: phosphatidylcholine/phosphatidylserine synthase [Geminicoccaceae bacterium]